jgi:hypothetical protein
MRTTVAIDDNVLAAAKVRAREQRTTLGRLVETALRRELAGAERPATIPLPVFTSGNGPRPGVDFRSNRALAEVLDDPTGAPESL